MRAQHGQHEVLERAGIVGIEQALLDEVQAHPGGGLGVLEDPGGVGGGEAGGLGHGRVEQRARARPLLAPGQPADDHAGETGEQDHQADQRQRQRRTTAEELDQKCLRRRAAAAP